jgi:hypothetical protein
LTLDTKFSLLDSLTDKAAFYVAIAESITPNLLSIISNLVFICNSKAFINWLNVKVSENVVSTYEDKSRLRSMVSSTICPYDPNVHLMLKHVTDNKGMSFTEASGKCAPYLLSPYNKATNGISVRSASFGCTLEISVLNNKKCDIDEWIPLCPDIHIIQLLTSNGTKNKNYCHVLKDKCMSIKRHVSQLDTDGPKYMIGENGGMNWTGTLSMFAQHFQYLTSTIRHNME